MQGCPLEHEVEGVDVGLDGPRLHLLPGLPHRHRIAVHHRLHRVPHSPQGCIFRSTATLHTAAAYLQRWPRWQAQGDACMPGGLLLTGHTSWRRSLKVVRGSPASACPAGWAPAGFHGASSPLLACEQQQRCYWAGLAAQCPPATYIAAHSA